MEWAATAKIGPNIGKERGKLIVHGNKVEWWRFGYIYRKYSMPQPIHSAVFAQFANCATPDELWVVVACYDRLVYSFGTVSGKSHIIGLNELPKSFISCGKQGIALTCLEPKSEHLRVYLLQGPEELLKNVAPSSVSSPLKANDDLVYCDENTFIVWNAISQSVKAYSLRILGHINQLHNLSAGDGLHKVAVFSPIREWRQTSIGKVFSQSLEIKIPKQQELALVAVHDSAAKSLYVLCGPELMRHDDIMFVTPLTGVHKFPLVVAVLSKNEVVLSCLFFPQLEPLLLQAESTKTHITDLISEPSANWFEIEQKDTKSPNRVTVVQCKDFVTLKCLNIMYEILGPAETAMCVMGYLVSKTRISDDLEAFSDAFIKVSRSVNTGSMSKLVVYLHMLREELNLLVEYNDATDVISELIRPFISGWGSGWCNLYGEVDRSAVVLECPCILDSPPSVFQALTNCMDPNMGNTLPDVVELPIFPTISQILLIFQMVSTCKSRDELNKFLSPYKSPEIIESFSPPLQACLLEILGFVGINPYDQRSPVEEKREHETPTSEMFHKREEIIRGLFPHDLRFNEALRLLQINQPQKCLFGLYVNPTIMSEHKFAYIQKIWGEELASRALGTAFGRAATDIGCNKPPLWEQLDAPFIDFSGECTETGITIPAVYKSLESAAECDPWGVFAQGTSLGLSISMQSPGIDSLWVITSAQLSATSTDLYSGFVYGMGLSGHLANLEDWQFYESLVSSNIRGTLAALLGVAASKKGSRDAKLTKVLSVHIRALLPIEAHSTQLVPPEVERAALISLGLLYMSQGVRHLTEALCRDLTWTPSEGNSLNCGLMNGEGSENNEARKLAIGIALGLINCGTGKASGLSELLPLITGLHDRSVYSAEIVNGALCAILLNFIGSNDQIVAAQIKLPKTREAAKYCTPSSFYARALTYHLILWEDVKITKEWIFNQVPSGLKPDVESDENTRLYGLWYYYSLAGVLTAVAMRYTATNNTALIETLVEIIESEFYDLYTRSLVEAIKECPPTDPSQQDLYCERNDYELSQTLQHIAQLLSSLSLALAAVATGSGDLRVLKLLRKLWQINSQFQASLAPSSPQGYGYMQNVGLDLTYISQAIGWLFLCGGQRSFKNDPKNVGFLTVFSFLNLLGGSNINRHEWQHLRYMWSLVTEVRCLYCQLDPSKNILIEIQLNSGKLMEARLPVILPPLHEISCVRVKDSRYVPKTVDQAELREVLQHGIQITTRESGRHTLESMLPSTKPKANWDQPQIRALRTTLQSLACNPQRNATNADIDFLLTFSEMWPGDNDSRLLKKRDIEQLKFSRWYNR